jgi:putative transposase
MILWVFMSSVLTLPMHGFGNVTSASRFCRAIDEIRQSFRIRSPMKQKISLAFQREAFCQRINVLKTLFSEA